MQKKGGRVHEIEKAIIGSVGFSLYHKGVYCIYLSIHCTPTYNKTVKYDGIRFSLTVKIKLGAALRIRIDRMRIWILKIWSIPDP